MLPRTMTKPPRRLRLLLGALLAGAVLLVAGPHGRAQGSKTGSALSLVPADAAYFGCLLRNKQQVDLLRNSNAYKALRSLPLVKMAWDKAEKDLNKDDGPLGMYKQFIQDKDNKELVDLLIEGASDEVFFYGGKTWSDFIKVAMAVNTAQSWAPLTALAAGQDPQRTQVRSMLLAAQKNRGLLKIPELVLGFKMNSADKAENQLKRLEKMAGALLENVPPLKGKLKRQMVGGANFLTLELDGNIIPWDDVNLKDYQDKNDEFEELVKAAKKLTACVSLGVKDGYLMFGITSSLKDIERLDPKGKSLATREELAPVEKAGSKPLVGISYTSRDYIAAVTSSYLDVQGLGESVKSLLTKAEGLKEERKKAIEKDVNALMADLNKIKPNYGARLGFSYLTPTGYEGYAYDYANQDALKGVSCKLGDNFGGSPIFAAAFGCKVTGENYQQLVKWVKVAYGHGEAAFLDSPAGEQEKELFKKATTALLPVWKRFDEITTKQLLPSLKDTGMGLVIDAKWSSKQWQKDLPPTEKPMPMLELGLLVGVSDGKGFERAMTDYRKTVNELIEKMRESAPMANIPDFKIPAPENEKVSVGSLLYYPLPPEAGLDKQVQPVAGVGKTVSVIALSKKHAERLMTATPLTFKGAPLSRKGDLVGLAVLDWPALVDAALPWVEFGLVSSGAIAQSTDGSDAGAKKGKDELAAILKQVKVIATVLKCYKGSSTVTYVEDGKLITHGEAIVKDLDKVPGKD